MSVVKSIKASSRASVKIGDSYYTVEYTEERGITETDNIENEREKLWNCVNSECDNQIQDILKVFRK